MMKRLLLIALTIAPVAVGAYALFAGGALRHAGQAPQEALLRDAGVHFNGVYQSAPHVFAQGQYWDYLRFYPDGEVISIGSTETPQEIATWFARRAATVRHGRVRVQGHHLSFMQDAGDDDTMAFSGEVMGDHIRFSVKEEGEDAAAPMVYRLVRVTLPPDAAPGR